MDLGATDSPPKVLVSGMHGPAASIDLVLRRLDLRSILPANTAEDHPSAHRPKAERDSAARIIPESPIAS
jgi:hypothetical protein